MRWSATPPTTSMSPRVVAAANAQVPAAMRSGTTAWSTALSSATPSTSITEVPAPVMHAPISVSRSAMSTISGSRAALDSRVRPEARTAALRTFSVAPTLGKSSRMSPPRSPCGASAMR